MQALEHSQARQRGVVSRLRRAASTTLVQASPTSTPARALVAAVAVLVLVSGCSIDSRPIGHATPARAAGADSGQDNIAILERASERAALAKRTYDSGEPLELARDAGTPRQVVDGGGALPPVDASTDAGELVDAGVHVDVDAGAGDAGQHDAGELVDASRCPFRCNGACSVWPCP